eukprot:scaffold3571_cov176-Amphora_coffeaeformis.AAC.28
MLSTKAVCNIFPFHIHLDGDLIIQSVGKYLPGALGVNREDLIGMFADSFFSFVQPHVTHWSRKCLKHLEDQDIAIESVFPSPVLKSRLVLSGSITCTSNSQQEYLFILTPDFDSLQQMKLPPPRYGLTGNGSLSTEATMTRPNFSSEQSTQKIASLTIKLEKEQSLLESLMPKHAAEGLRSGRHIDPVFHDNVTMFFSDIAGFTKMCDQIFPWGKCGSCRVLKSHDESTPFTLLIALSFCSNRNHRCFEPSILHHGSPGKEIWCECRVELRPSPISSETFLTLCVDLQLFKIETIGDAYVCAAGLPVVDPNHAEKVATFALAVSHCARHILSPVDNKPLQLRVGIHTGSCASGVVGTTNPRYCVFGDTVNITSRHESTGEADRVHTSHTTVQELMAKCGDKFVLHERGQVDMKGKGLLTTYWLAASDTNEAVNAHGLTVLDNEVKKVLYDADFGCSTERGSKEKMENFSPAKMQKVALSLDKLAVDVLKRSSMMLNCSGEDKTEENTDQNTCSSTRDRSDSLSLEDLDETSLPEPTDNDSARSTFSKMLRSLNELDDDEMKKGIVTKFAQMMDSKTFMELYDSADF